MSENSRKLAPNPSRRPGSNIWPKTLLLSLAFLVAGQFSYAQYGEVSVIGFSQDGKLAAVRKVVIGEESPGDEGHEYTMEIRSWDLARNKVVNTFPVITQKDTDVIRADMKDKAGDIAKLPRMRRLRARRWKKVNRSLKSIGFNIVKLPTPIKATGKDEKKDFDLKHIGLAVWFEVYPKTIKRDADKGITGSFPKVDLVFGRNDGRVVLRKIFYDEEARRGGFAFMQLEASNPRQYIKALYLSPDKNYIIAIDRGRVMVFDLKAHLKRLEGK